MSSDLVVEGTVKAPCRGHSLQPTCRSDRATYFDSLLRADFRKSVFSRFSALEDLLEFLEDLEEYVDATGKNDLWNALEFDVSIALEEFASRPLDDAQNDDDSEFLMAFDCADDELLSCCDPDEDDAMSMDSDDSFDSFIDLIPDSMLRNIEHKLKEKTKLAKIRSRPLVRMHERPATKKRNVPHHRFIFSSELADPADKYIMSLNFFETSLTDILQTVRSCDHFELGRVEHVVDYLRSSSCSCDSESSFVTVVEENVPIVVEEVISEVPVSIDPGTLLTTLLSLPSFYFHKDFYKPVPDRLKDDLINEMESQKTFKELETEREYRDAMELADIFKAEYYKLCYGEMAGYDDEETFTKIPDEDFNIEGEGWFSKFVNKTSAFVSAPFDICADTCVNMISFEVNMIRLMNDFWRREKSCEMCWFDLFEAINCGGPLLQVLGRQRMHHCKQHGGRRDVCTHACEQSGRLGIFTVLFYFLLHKYLNAFEFPTNKQMFRSWLSEVLLGRGTIAKGVHAIVDIVNDMLSKYFFKEEKDAEDLDKKDGESQEDLEQTNEQEQTEKAEGEMNTFLIKGLFDMFRALNPFSNIDEKTFFETEKKCRGFNTISTSASKISRWGLVVFDKTLNVMNGLTQIFPEDIVEWIRKVDAILVLDKDADGHFKTLAESVQACEGKCDEIHELYRDGQHFKTVITLSGNVFQSNEITRRLDGLQRIVTKLTGYFIGAKHKDKATLLYLCGEPGVGKTVLVNHLFNDIWMATKGRPFDETRDKYARNPVSEYDDGYMYQPVYEVTDILQARDKNLNIAELLAMIHLADESSAPLNMSAVEDKGQFYFNSPWVVCTSNLHPDRHDTIIESAINDTEAFKRRIDLLIEVQRIPRPDAEPGFDKASMFFVVTPRGQQPRRCNWWEFVAIVIDYHKKSRASSSKLLDLNAAYSPDDTVKINELLELPNPILRCPFEDRVPTKKVKNVKISCWNNAKPCALCYLFKDKHADFKYKAYSIINPAHTRARVGNGIHICTDKCKINNDDSVDEEETQAPFAHGESGVEEDCDENTVFHKACDYAYGVLKNNPRAFSGDEECDPWREFEKMNQLTGFAIKIYFGNDIRYYDGHTYLYTVRFKRVGEDFYLLCTSRDVFKEGSGNGFFSALLERLRKAKERLVDWLQSLNAFGFLNTITFGLTGWIFDKWTAFKLWLLNFIVGKPALASFLSSMREKVVKYGKLLLGLVGGFLVLLGGYKLYKYFKGTSNEESSVVFEPSEEEQVKEEEVKSAEPVIGESGAEDSSKGNKKGKKGKNKLGSFHRPARYTVRNAQGEMLSPWPVLPASGEMTVGESDILLHNIRPNIGIVETPYGKANCFALKDRFVLFTQHDVLSEDEQIEMRFYGGQVFKFCLNEVASVVSDPAHYYIVDLSTHPEGRRVRSFSDATKYLLTNEEIARLDSDGFLYSFEIINCHAHTVVKIAQSVQPYLGTIDIAKLGHIFPCGDRESICLVSYSGVSVPGDCGAPLIVLGSSKPRIAGFHVAKSEGSSTRYASALTQETFLDIVSKLKYAVGEMAPIAAPFPTSLEYVQFVDRKEIFCPRKSQLVKSIFWTKDCMFAPARLKGYVDDKTPMQRSFEKNIMPCVVHVPSFYDDQVSELYEEFKGVKSPKVILTLEQAVFGDEDLNISSIASDASLGHPLMGKYKRKDLIRKDDRFIHALISDDVNAIWKQLNEGVTPEFLAVDMLKDEKLPVEKVEAGKTRTFCVLPLAINLVLKQLFGCFVQMVTDHHAEGTCKVGLAVQEPDVAALARFLELDNPELLYLCGDISASDRVIPQEVFQCVTEMVNEWYKDDYSAARTLIARELFSVVHHAEGIDYRLHQGMPSGCYLTAVFNSLAYAIIIRKVFCIVDIPLRRLATFGDDHVAVIHANDRRDAHYIIDAFQSLGLTYTSADKTSSVDWEKADTIVFLQRKFVKKCGMWFMPMNPERVRHSIMWYRRTTEVRQWSKSKLVTSLLNEAFAEFAISGEDVYNAMLLHYAPEIKEFKVKLDSFDKLLKDYLCRGSKPAFVGFALCMINVPFRDVDLYGEVLEGEMFSCKEEYRAVQDIRLLFCSAHLAMQEQLSQLSEQVFLVLEPLRNGADLTLSQLKNQNEKFCTNLRNLEENAVVSMMLDYKLVNKGFCLAESADTWFNKLSAHERCYKELKDHLQVFRTILDSEDFSLPKLKRAQRQAGMLLLQLENQIGKIVSNYRALMRSKVFTYFPTRPIAIGEMGDPLKDVGPSDTTIGSDEPARTVAANLTTFVENKSDEECIEINSILPPLDDVFRWGRDYCKSAERLFQLGSMTLNSSNPPVTPIMRLVPVMSLMNNSYLQARIFPAYAMRFGIEIQIRVVATKFHYGQLFCCFRPGFYDNQAACQVGFASDIEFAQPAWGAWDSIYSASQLEGKVIPITQGPVQTFCLKWHYPFNYIETYNASFMSSTTIKHGFDIPQLFKFCTFDVYQLTPAAPADLDRPQIVVWGRFIDLELYGYTGRGIDAPVNIKEMNFLTLPKAVAVGQSDEVSEKSKGTWTQSVLHTLSSVAGTISHIFPFDSILSKFGLSHPRNMAPPMMVNRVAYGTAQSVGVSNALTTSYRADCNQPELFGKPEELTLDAMGNKWMFLEYFSLSTSSSTYSRELKTDQTGQQFGLGWVMHPGAYIAAHFLYVRHDYALRFHFSASAMLSARVAIVCSPVFGDNLLTFAKFSKIVDLEGDQVVEFHLPYMRETQYAISGANWRIDMKLVSTIVSPEAAETRPILVSLWVSMPGLECHSFAPYFDGTNYSYWLYPMGKYEPHTFKMSKKEEDSFAAEFTPPVSKTVKPVVPTRDLFKKSHFEKRTFDSGRFFSVGKNGELSPLAIGEMAGDNGESPMAEPRDNPQAKKHPIMTAPTSLYHIMKRVGALRIGVKDDGHIGSFRPFRGQGEKNGHDVMTSFWQNMMYMFKYYKGGADVFIPNATGPDIIASDAVHPYDDDHRSNAYNIDDTASFGGLIFPEGSGTLVNFPYRAATPYIFTEMPILDDSSTGAGWTFGSHLANMTCLVKNNVDLYFGPADDFEVGLFMGTPVVNYTQIAN